MWFDLDYKSAKIDKKWNIGNFITSSYKTARGITVNGADASEVDLNKNLNAIVKDYGRNEKEYDTLYRELMLKRNETKKEISEMKASNAKFADIISAQNNDITIMGTQLRVLEDKQKLTSEKYKTMQAERKLWKELTAKQVVEEKPAVNNFISNSPLSVGQMATSTAVPTTIPIAAVAPTAIPTVEHKRPENFLDPIYETANAELKDKEEKEGAKSPSAPIAPVPGSDIVVSRDVYGNAVRTVADQLDEKMDIVKVRLAKKDNLINASNALGHNYNTSIDNIIMNKTPHKVKLFVNPDTGRFWEKAFTRDENGEYTIEAKEFHPRSVTHLGDLQFDIMAKQVTTYYDDVPIEFELDRNESHMGEFYMQEWNDPKTEKFLIPAEITNQMESVLS